MSCIDLSRPGPHALVFLMQAGRFIAEDKAAVERVLDVFGMDSAQHMILLFPWQDSGQDSLSRSDHEALQDVVQRCSSRTCTFSPDAAKEERARQASELMGMLQELVAKNGWEPCARALYTEAGLTESKLRAQQAENRRARRRAEGKCRLS